MATTLALRFLPFLLFIFMNGHGICASRELQDQKEVDSVGATPVSTNDDEPNYLTGYITTPKSTQPNYKASYTSKKHNHPSHHGNLNDEPYITGYITTPDSTQHDYISSYTFKKHDHPSHNDEKLDEPYITGYITTPKSTQPDYKASYTTFKNHDEKLNEPYLTGYITTSDSVQPDYKASYTFKKHNHPSHSHHEKLDEPYITGYITSNHDSKQDPKAIAHDSTKPYVTSYALHPKKDSKESATQDSNDEPYITQYGTGPKSYLKESSQDHDKPYITQYGNHDSKQDYETTYKRKQEESKWGPSSNVDHTEAFKTGFFSLDDLYVGNIMPLQFPVQEFSHSLPRKEADSIPFSTSQLPSVLQLFSISEDSPMAKSMRGTLEQCEAETITGETKICANSLESMLEFVNAIIGSDTKYDILTTSHPAPSATPLQKYAILEVSKDIYAPKWVACHPLPYPYAVYYCHFIATGSKVFKVLLSGENGDKMEALGICHLDTSDWSPDHILFKQLGFMPGEAPVCHFFPVKHLMWVPQPLTATM